MVKKDGAVVDFFNRTVDACTIFKRKNRNDWFFRLFLVAYTKYSDLPLECPLKKVSLGVDLTLRAERMTFLYCYRAPIISITSIWMVKFSPNSFIFQTRSPNLCPNFSHTRKEGFTSFLQP